ncbi:hypothetical protein [Niastella vici]|nr:hypothetical protein [Niastella vici]
MNTVLLKFIFLDEEQLAPDHDLVDALLSSFRQDGQLSTEIKRLKYE